MNDEDERIKKKKRTMEVHWVKKKLKQMQNN